MYKLHLCKGGVIMNRSDRERYEEEKRQQQYYDEERKRQAYL